MRMCRVRRDLDEREAERSRGWRRSKNGKVAAVKALRGKCEQVALGGKMVGKHI